VSPAGKRSGDHVSQQLKGFTLIVVIVKPELGAQLVNIGEGGPFPLLRR
jgi:hypothetical protein